MPDRPRIVQSAARANNEPVKPQPPGDLWEQLDALNASMTDGIVTRGFTVDEYAQRFGISRNAAESRVDRLLNDRKISYIGKKISVHGRLAKAYDVVQP